MIRIEGRLNEVDVIYGHQVYTVSIRESPTQYKKDLSRRVTTGSWGHIVGPKAVFVYP